MNPSQSKMPAIYIRTPLSEINISALRQEFPSYQLIFQCESAEDWESVEILFGDQLSIEELEYAKQLKWIHCTSPQVEGIPVEAIHEQGNIFITISKGGNISQVTEFVIGAILGFAKQFFLWPQASRNPQEFWDWPLKDTIWSLKSKILLQIGLGEIGTSIVKTGNSLGLKTWGVQIHRTFHPYCKKTFSIKNLHSILPVADIVVLALPKKGYKEEKLLFTHKEFELMKSDSLFILVGSADYIDEEALAEVGKTGKFRGVLIDAYTHAPPEADSPLWNIPNIILTPSIASYPEAKNGHAFKIFRRNLRLFILGNTREMKNLLS